MQAIHSLPAPARTAAGALAITVALALAPAAARAGQGDLDLSSMSLEELMEVEVTSVSKRAQKRSEAPAAVTVLTSEDIRRSGMTTIPDLLRMVPGLHVANIDASTWAITARGFNSQFANKLLVMIDGRSVYTPLFSGVYWDVQDLMLEDIDRIEVVRGPGGTVWGANAVNGVINIITKEASQTQGLLLSSLSGSQERFTGGGRYGGALGDDLHYRAYVKYLKRDDFDDRDGIAAHDAWDAMRGGFRLDWALTGSDALTLQGDYYDGSSNETLLSGATGRADTSGGNALARWTHTFAEDSDLSLQLYYDRTERGGDLLREDRDTVDVDFQHRFRPLPRTDLVWGAGYRMTSDEIRDSAGVGFAPAKRTDHLFSAFVENEVTLVEELLKLSVGSKFEHNDYTGFEFQPSGRLLFTPHERHTLWAAVSRAVRAPSRAEEDVALLVPMTPTVFALLNGNEDFESEDLLAYEVGYRARPVDRVSLDAALYYNVYHDLRSLEPGPPVFGSPGPGLVTIPTLGDNKYDAVGYGIELSATVDVTDFWRLIAGYTLMKVQMDADKDSVDLLSDGQEDDVPSNQVHLISRLDLPWSFEFDNAVYYVGSVGNQDVGKYVRWDTRLGWRPTENLELSLVGQNLAERRHDEFGPSYTRLSTSVPRAVYGKVVWRY